ncbi:transposase [Myxococcus sp. AM001]|nr:transposase [Myxococcus sp. AM001]
MVAERKAVTVTIDWTDFESDDHTTVAIQLVTRHGRATPLLWKTVPKSELAGQRNAHEDALLERLHQVLPSDVEVTVLADRGFGDVALYELLDRLGFGYVIRFRGVVHVESAGGEVRKAKEWVPPTGRPKLLRGARVTQARFGVGAVVCVHQKGMKEAWFLAASSKEATATELVKAYGRRFTCEETCRDITAVANAAEERFGGEPDPYVVRFREDMRVEVDGGHQRPASDWLPTGERSVTPPTVIRARARPSPCSRPLAPPSCSPGSITGTAAPAAAGTPTTGSITRSPCSRRPPLGGITPSGPSALAPQGTPERSVGATLGA